MVPNSRNIEATGWFGRKYRKYTRQLSCWYAINRGNKPVVKVYGLLRTGTNYITRLVELNFDTFCLESVEEGWKHGPCVYRKDFYYIFMVKDPYSWIVSFYDWEFIHNRTSVESLSEFIHADITHPELKRVWGIKKPLSAWNETLESWSKYSECKNVIFLRYEDLIASYTDQLTALGERFALTRKHGKFVNLEKRADDWTTPNPRRKLSHDYYIKNQYLERFTPDDLELMRNNLDKKLVKHFGYKVL